MVIVGFTILEPKRRVSHFKLLHIISPKLKIMMALVSHPDLCLVTAPPQLCLLTVWSVGELVHRIVHLSDFHNFFCIKVNECKQGEQNVAAAVKDAVLCLAPLQEARKREKFNFLEETT